ncbi:MAG: O-methyltransferase [Planctomycetota bacterium]|nr:O-methyltransferase [Planctomycetota bacterium]
MCKGDFEYTAILEYTKMLVPPRHAQLIAMERRAREQGFPIIGPEAGIFCYQIARLMNAKEIFELGSGFGYSTAFFALAVRDNGGGKVHHTEWDRQKSDEAGEYLSAMGLADYVEFHVGEAVELLKTHEVPFDIIFNDIDKEGYPASLDVIEPRLREGGVLIIDNMLWDGRVFDAYEKSKSTEGVRQFTAKMAKSDNWTMNLVPIRDGLIFATKTAGNPFRY